LYTYFVLGTYKLLFTHSHSRIIYTFISYTDKRAKTYKHHTWQREMHERQQ